MSTFQVSEQQVVDALRRVPGDRWEDVIRYLKALETVAMSDAGSPIRTAADLAASDLVGMWADRTDIHSSHEFARRLRQQAEQRQG